MGGATLLDIGGGIGAIHHELLQEGAASAVHVDASAAYLEKAKGEAERRGHRDRVRFLHGDFVDIVGSVPQADVVTLDRVICCYPDVERLVHLSAERSDRYYGLVYPRDSWWMRLAFPVPNLYFRARSCPFRIFLHPVARVDQLIRDCGFTEIFKKLTAVWLIALYRR